MPHCFIGLSKDVYYYFAHNSGRSSADRENKINSRMILYVDMLIACRRESSLSSKEETTILLKAVVGLQSTKSRDI